MKRFGLLFMILAVGLSGFSAFAAVPQGDLTVIGAGELEQALGTVIAEAQTQLEGGADAPTLFRSPAFLTALFGLLGAFPVFFGTNGLKLSTTWIRGNKTRILAVLLSAVAAGVPAYFSVSQVAGMNGPGGIGAAVAAALGALLLAIGKHETDRTRQTGQRQPERKNAALSGTVDLVLDGLLREAAKLPPPFGLAASVVTGLYAKHGKAFVQDLISAQRALSEAELAKAGDDFERANPVSVVPAGGAR